MRQDEPTKSEMMEEEMAIPPEKPTVYTRDKFWNQVNLTADYIRDSRFDLRQSLDRWSDEAAYKSREAIPDPGAELMIKVKPANPGFDSVICFETIKSYLCPEKLL
jgi:hypothetical protein